MKPRFCQIFFFDHLLGKYPDKTIESLNKLANEAKIYIVRFQDVVLQNLWYQKLANILGIDSSLLQIKNINSQNIVNQNINYKNVFSKNLNNQNINYKNIKNNINYKHIYRKKNYITYNNPPISNAGKAISMLLVDPKLLSLSGELQNCRLNDLKSKLPLDIDLLLKIIDFLKTKGKSIEDYKNLDPNSTSLNLDNYYQIIDELEVIMEPMYMQKLISLDALKIVHLIYMFRFYHKF